MKNGKLNKKPIEYILGFSDFLNCKIDLSLEPFIPRPETEYWTSKAIEEIKERGRKISCLDIFSGSGCVGIAVLKSCPELCQRIDFAEKEKKLLKQIKINLDLNDIERNKYRIIQSDIFKNIKNKYDYIFANPPYIPLTRINKIQKSVLLFEPKKALFGGKDGLFYVKKFLKEAKSHLKKDARVYMEFDYFYKTDLEKLLKKFGYKNYKICKDQYKKERYLVIFAGS